MVGWRLLEGTLLQGEPETHSWHFPVEKLVHPGRLNNSRKSNVSFWMFLVIRKELFVAKYQGCPSWVVFLGKFWFVVISFSNSISPKVSCVLEHQKGVDLFPLTFLHHDFLGGIWISGIQTQGGCFGGEDPLRQRIFVEKVLPGGWDWFHTFDITLKSKDTRNYSLMATRNPVNSPCWGLFCLFLLVIIYIDLRYIPGILNHQHIYIYIFEREKPFPKHNFLLSMWRFQGGCRP